MTDTAQFTQEEITLAQAGIVLPTVKPLRPMADILSDLAKPIPKMFLEEREQGGAKLTYWPWWVGVLFFNKYAPGWSWVPGTPVFSGVAAVDELVKAKKFGDPPTKTGNIVSSSAHVAITGLVYVPCLESGFPGISRGGEGGDYEHAVESKRANGFDPLLDAARQAMKRAFSLFGFGLYLYLPQEIWQTYFDSVKQAKK